MPDASTHLSLGAAIMLVLAWSGCTEGTRSGPSSSSSTSSGSGNGSSSTSAGGAGGGTQSSTASGDPFASCSKGLLENDRTEDVPLSGPGVDAMGHLASGQYYVATTYLALVPSQTTHAKQLGAAVIGSLSSMQGMVAFSISSSEECASLRTLSVWQSEEDMLAFVTSPAHATAMSQISTLSRGSSDTIAWAGDAGSATWTEAASELATK